MNAITIILALIAGWCGTPYPHRWRFPYPFPEPLPPQPRPCYVCGNFLGAVGGVVATLTMTYVLGKDVSIEATLIAGYIGGRFTNDSVARLMDNFKNQ